MLHSLPNNFVGEIPCTKEQYDKALELCRRFNISPSFQSYRTEGNMIVSEFNGMTIGILPDGSSHS